MRSVRRTLSPYKFKRLAEEALRNSLRLHGDALLLHMHGSYPSAFQLSVLALEELSKAKAVSHYYYSAITNEGLPDAEFEQEFLLWLYSHTEKQYAFVAREMFDYSPKLVRLIKAKKLELKKQSATYVGLERIGKKVDVTSRISAPSRIKEHDARQLLSLMNSEFIQIFETVQSHGDYFGIEEADGVINPEEHQFLFVWPYRTGLKSRRFLKMHVAPKGSKNAG